MIEWTVNIGAIVAGAFNALVMVAAAISFYFGTKFHNQIVSRELGILGGRMINVENEMKELTKIITVQAVQATEITALNARLTASERTTLEWQQWVREKLDRLETRERH